MSMKDLLSFQGEAPKDLETINQWNDWMASAMKDELWTPKQLQEYLGLGSQRLQELRRREGIPGFICMGDGIYLYLRKFAEPWAADYLANRKGRVGRPSKGDSAAPVGAQGAQGKPAKPKVARVPAYIKKVQQDTPHLIVNDHNVPVDAPGVSSMHHHWADLQGYSEVPKRLEKWRRFKFQGMSCVVPLRYKHPKHFSFALLQDIGRYFPQFCVLSDNLDYGFDLTDTFRTYSRHPHADTAFADDPGYAVFKQFMALREEAWNIRDKIKSIYIGM